MVQPQVIPVKNQEKVTMCIFRDFRLENCTKTAFYAILRHYLTKNVHRCAIRERLKVTVDYDVYPLLFSMEAAGTGIRKQFLL